MTNIILSLPKGRTLAIPEHLFRLIIDTADAFLETHPSASDEAIKDAQSWIEEVRADLGPAPVVMVPLLGVIGEPMPEVANLDPALVHALALDPGLFPTD